jgi:phosphotransferase system  glucose/maltose/N-acetylglucosamine-specific IIC component
MTNLKRPVNIFFLIALASLALAFVVFNFLIYQKEKEKGKAQTAKARQAKEEKLIEKNNQDETDNNPDISGAEV